MDIIPNEPLPTPVFIPDNLIAEILSFLNVKSILQFKCVNKSWNTLISDPTFIQMHLKKSPQNPHLAIFWNHLDHYKVVPFPFHRLLQNPSIKLDTDNLYPLNDFSQFKLVGSCNGLLCLFFSKTKYFPNETTTYWFRFWNPSTRITSEMLGLCDYTVDDDRIYGFKYFNFVFGYVESTKTYKVVAFRVEYDEKDNKASGKSEVKVFSFDHNCWKNIQSFPVIPLNLLGICNHRRSAGVHLSGTVNWLALRDHLYPSYAYSLITSVQQFVIVSLDLSTEKYTQFLLPLGFDEVPFIPPILSVLRDCLCFSYDSNKTEFVLWQMKEYGVHESWTPLLSISYRNIKTNYIHDDFQMTCLYMNDDKAVFAFGDRHWAVIYNMRDKIMEVVEVVNKDIDWFSGAKDFVESLVSVS
ncbi:F-box/kelch-repeat protein At3g23880-like [Cicer arietinum]|uniref:F-box/kelch-repeat protein At3g23880-like n=1 Tax=Cicer arietinum TaxID=3827 RepID=A0A1S2XP71_CICAR|nr:F-box/kelch-repeat protein At3g23880-like [Cicer arietinum]